MRRNQPIVIAKDYRDFRSWCWLNGLHHANATCIDQEHKVRGMSLTRSQIRYAELAYHNKDILEIEQAVHIACMRREEDGDMAWFSTDRGRAHLSEQEARAELAQLDKLRREAELTAPADPERDAIMEAINNNLNLLDVAELKNLKGWMEVPGFLAPEPPRTLHPFYTGDKLEAVIIKGRATNDVLRGVKPTEAYIDEAQELLSFDAAAEARSEHYREQYLGEPADGKDD